MENITLDFTQASTVAKLTENQPLAVMPAELAKKLLINYADQLRAYTTEEIINRHISRLQEAKTLDDAIQISLSWINERDLVKNVAHRNWDVYTVPETTEEPAIVKQWATKEH